MGGDLPQHPPPLPSPVPTVPQPPPLPSPGDSKQSFQILGPAFPPFPPSPQRPTPSQWATAPGVELVSFGPWPVNTLPGLSLAVSLGTCSFRAQLQQHQVGGLDGPMGQTAPDSRAHRGFADGLGPGEGPPPDPAARPNAMACHEAGRTPTASLLNFTESPGPQPQTPNPPVFLENFPLQDCGCDSPLSSNLQVPPPSSNSQLLSKHLPLLRTEARQAEVSWGRV